MRLFLNNASNFHSMVLAQIFQSPLHGTVGCPGRPLTEC